MDGQHEMSRAVSACSAESLDCGGKRAPMPATKASFGSTRRKRSHGGIERDGWMGFKPSNMSDKPFHFSMS